MLHTISRRLAAFVVQHTHPVIAVRLTGRNMCRSTHGHMTGWIYADVWTRRATCCRALESQTYLVTIILQLYPTSRNSTDQLLIPPDE